MVRAGPSAPPRATARLQFHRGFTFADAEAAVPYLAELGISHLYASPLLRARRDSSHGYDVVDFGTVNPEVGGREGLDRLAASLHRRGMGLVLDIVPNHMAADAAENRWWRDVLARGRASAYARFFDIDWSPPERWLRGKVLLPVLGRPYAEALGAGEIRFERDAASGAGEIVCPGHRLPVAEGSEAAAGADGLEALLDAQHYRLAWWRTAGDAINWRRFFNITGLVALRAERAEVFAATHGLVLELFRAGTIDGVRVDHVDGLVDPGAYCRRLRRALARAGERRAYIVVEKILAAGETLPAAWEADGTTGYDFMAEAGGLLHDPAGAAPLTRLWTTFAGEGADFAAVESGARAELAGRVFAAEAGRAVRALAEAVGEPAGEGVAGRAAAVDFPPTAIGRAVAALASHFPVYRLYPGGGVASERVLERAAAAARPSVARADRHLLERLRAMLTAEGAAARRAQMRFQMLTAPLAAKAVEDTAFYRYGRLLSRNEVGASPEIFSVGIAEFHAAVLARQKRFPQAMLATATHDHKRGEDVRARLAVLSEIPAEWAAAVEGWRHCNGARRRRLAGGPAPAPGPGEELMLYQILVGAWPALLDAGDEPKVRAFAERVAGWQEKALREAKQHSDWAEPDAAHEAACRDFLLGMLGDLRLRREVAAFAARIGPAGAVNGLAQTMLRLAVPGVPDLYQGAELWDESLVDPDNRRPVDFEARSRALADTAPVPELLCTWRSGHVKQALIARMLGLRARLPQLFAAGDYRPIRACGRRAEHVVAFVRSEGAFRLLIAVARLAVPLLGSADEPRIDPEAWEDTCLMLPEPEGEPWRDVLGRDNSLEPERRLRAAGVFRGLPVACWLAGESRAGPES